jgi:hypothetical protein
VDGFSVNNQNWLFQQPKIGWALTWRGRDSPAPVSKYSTGCPLENAYNSSQAGGRRDGFTGLSTDLLQPASRWLIVNVVSVTVLWQIVAGLVWPRALPVILFPISLFMFLVYWVALKILSEDIIHQPGCPAKRIPVNI